MVRKERGEEMGKKANKKGKKGRKGENRGKLTKMPIFF